MSQLAKQRQTILMPDLSLPTDWQPEFYANLRTIKNLRQLATWQFGSPSRCQNKSSYDSTNLFPTGLISSQLLQILKVILVGGHHALLIGEPGTGKSFITQIVPYLQASLNPRQEWEKTLFQQQFQIKSDSIMVLADQTDSFAGLFGSVRPWQAGKINAANYGIMIADELPLWSKRNLDGLLAPMAQLPRTLFYKQNSLQIFSNLSVVGLANPCPCSQSSNSICQCNLATIHKYKSKFSAALLDRFAIQWRIGCHDLTKMRTTEWLQAKKQIISARKIQNQRINLGFPHQASLYNQEQVLQLLPSFGQTGQDELNWRKRLQIAQVGITLADLDAQPVTKSHLQLAKLLTQNIWGQD